MSETQEAAQVAEQATQEAQEIANQQEVETPEAAQEQAATDEDGTETDSQEKSTQADEKKFSQDEVNEIVKKQKAKAAAIAERKAAKAYAEKLEQLAVKPQEQRQAEPAKGEPKLEDFEQVQDYVKAVTKWTMQTAQQEQARQTEEQRVRKIQNEVQAKAVHVFELAEQDPEFDAEAFESLTNLSDPMAFAIMDSDIAPKLMVYLQKNPDEVDRIAKLSPARQAAEIGKMEVKLSIPVKVKTSNAPAPIKPVGSRGSGVAGDPSKMSQADFEKWLYKR